MRKQKRGRKFHRKTGPREALLEGLAQALILKEKIKVSQAKAKTLSSFVEKKITQAKKGNLAATRQLRKDLSEAVVKKLIKDIAPLYKNRAGGYTRITKLGPRRGDGSKMAFIEFVK